MVESRKEENRVRQVEESMDPQMEVARGLGSDSELELVSGSALQTALAAIRARTNSRLSPELEPGPQAARAGVRIERRSDFVS